MSGSVTLPSRRSLPMGFPTARVSPVKSSRSSTIWNATPRLKPYSRSACSCSLDTLPSTPPIWAQPPNRYAVLRRMMSKCSSSVMSASPFLVSWYSSPSIILSVTSHSRRTMSMRVVRERHRHRLDVEVVAEEHRDVVAPPRMHRQAAAAQLRLVDDVVVDQRRRVDELDDGRVEDGAVAPCSRSGAPPSAGRPGARACRRSSGCTARSWGSGRPATGRAARTRDRPSRGRRESARRSARGRAASFPQGFR